MRIRTLFEFAVAAAFGAALTGGVLAATAATPATSTVYYACLSGGTLTKVGTTPPKCTAPAKNVSWNETGPTGPAGTSVLSGTGAPATNIGAVGDFYIETSNHTLYGPAAHECIPLPCHTIWGPGTSLVGPAVGPSYDTELGNPVQDPSGQHETVIAQKLPIGGDYQVSAYATAENTGGNATAWECALDAANPDQSPVTLDANVSAAGSNIEVSDSPIPLQGVVSIAAGGTISVVCQENLAGKNDEFRDAHITSAKITGFASVAPSVASREP